MAHMPLPICARPRRLSSLRVTIEGRKSRGQTLCALSQCLCTNACNLSVFASFDTGYAYGIDYVTIDITGMPPSRVATSGVLTKAVRPLLIISSYSRDSRRPRADVLALPIAMSEL